MALGFVLPVTPLTQSRKSSATLLDRRSASGARGAVATRMSLKRPTLVFVTPDNFSVDLDKALAVTRAALQGGCTLVQLRDRKAGQAGLQSLASHLLASGVSPSQLVVNGLGADAVAAVSPRLGMHAREAGLADTLAAARGALAAPALLGAAVHSTKAARAAVAAGAQYLQVGTMFATQSHPGKIPEGPPLMRDVREAVGPDVSLIGIGGIDATNVAEVLDAGADGVAVVSLLAGANDPAAAAHTLLRAMQR